jgi:hypothetical protein
MRVASGVNQNAHAELIATARHQVAAGVMETTAGTIRNQLSLRIKAQAGSGFPWGADHPWGLVSVSGNQVTIAAGRFYAGAGLPLVTAQTAFTIANDASYIGLEYAPTAGTLSLIGPTTSEPIPGDGKFRCWLYFFSFNGTNARYVKENLYTWHAAMYAYEP